VVEPSADKRSGGLLCIALVFLLAAAGCGSLGARTAQVDQASYAVALSEAQKSLLLTNIVRMRYGEPASFVSLAQVVQGYTLRSSADAAIDFGLVGNETPTVGGNITYEDRPTLTLTPIQGRDFRNGFLVPVPPQTVISALVIGWPPDLVLRLGVQSINGISNALISGDMESDADPRFLRIARLMQELIVGNVIELTLERPEEGAPVTVLVIRNPDRSSTADIARLQELRQLLGLSSRANRISVGFGRTRPRGGDEVNIQTRSYIQMLYAVAGTIDVPQDDVAAGITRRTVADDPISGRPTLAIRSGSSDPGAMHAKTKYNGRWFWIENADIESKRAFALLITLLTLTDVSEGAQAPLLTIGG
jgi:hypothetical protein